MIDYYFYIHNRPNRLTFVYTVAHPISNFGLLTWLDTIVLVCGRLHQDENNQHTNDEYELFTRVHTSKCVVTFVLRDAAAR